ncbi:tetratricopeptide repeat protein [Novosphingobium sp. PS1R-30]|uniref:Tetratricopeptide repeat protein n=1 Tax=Novosphingobium anseongense TaxID=3133436 RepID=A0ABU8RT59_9SPHN
MPMTATSAKDLLMRYTPAALALSLLVAVTSSVSFSAPAKPLDPRASALLAQGRSELSAGRVNEAVDAYEAALTVQPGNIQILLDLAEATRRQGMQGKALHYYREALKAEPSNVQAISGEGAALAEKGAIEKARRNLSRLEGLCGSNCEATRTLSAVIAKGPPPRVVSADAVKPQPVVSEN